jgi:hypothetical protein
MRVRSRCKACHRPIALPTDGSPSRRCVAAPRAGCATATAANSTTGSPESKEN